MDEYTRDQLDAIVARSFLPGVDADETRAVREFLRREGANFDRYRFNVRVGEGVELRGDYTDKFKADWARRTSMRLDLVCLRDPNAATIVEGKVQWTNAAVWQLLHYRDAYQEAEPTHTIDLVGVAEAYTPQAVILAKASGIRLHIYGFPPDLPAAPASREETV